MNVTRVSVLFLVLFAPFAAAQLPDVQEGIFKSPLNSANRPRFREICRGISSQPVVRGDFVQTRTIKSLGRTLVSSGVFTISREGMIWDTRKPYPSITAVGRDYLVEINGGKKTRLETAGNAAFVRIAETMSAVFSGDAKALEEGFEVYFAESNGAWSLGLIPRDPLIKQFAPAIIIKGSSGTHIASLFFQEQKGDTISYALSNQQFAQSLTDDEKACFSR
ncbi:MAG: outer membrane lipoprotein carrier protein LolA [Treponema sp.]|nr:outer membrane lipoprotein carrier protein LolA [Treponema sp.]